MVQTQEVDLKAAKAKVAQAQQLEKDLQEARRQVAVIAEDDEDLRDKVPITLIVCLCPRNTCIAVSDPHEPEAKRAQRSGAKNLMRPEGRLQYQQRMLRTSVV